MSRKMCRFSIGIVSASLFFLAGQGCPGTGGGGDLPGSITIDTLLTTAAVVGGVGHIRVTLVDPVSADRQVSISNSNPAIADVASSVTIVNGSDSGTVDHTGLAAGSTTITASIGDSQAGEILTVVATLQLEDLFLGGVDFDTN